MKTLLTLTASVLMISASTGLSQIESKAKALVQDTLELVYTREFAKVWESFSEPSKEEFRKAYLESRVAEKERPAKAAPALQISKVDAAIMTDEQRRELELRRNVPIWVADLRSRGFSEDLDAVKNLTSQEFWEDWISEQRLKDREYHAPTEALASWPKGKSPVPFYQVEAVAVAGDRVFVILRVPPELERSLLALINGSSVSYSPARPPEFPVPDQRMVWTATLVNGSLRLDVPESLVRFYRLHTLALRRSAR